MSDSSPYWRVRSIGLFSSAGGEETRNVASGGEVDAIDGVSRVFMIVGVITLTGVFCLRGLPRSRRGSSDGDGGGGGLLRSISGGSFLIRSFRTALPATDLRLLDLETLALDGDGVMSTSRGGVKRSVGGS